MTITAERLHELVTYDPETGVFTWNVPRGNQTSPGDRAGYTRKDGYLVLILDRRAYLGHRVAWFYVHGEWAQEVDHINGNPADTRLVNLRPVTRSQNMMNMGRSPRNTSGHKGVSWAKNDRKWQAYITLNRRKRSLGYHADINDAIAARRAAEAEIFGEFARPQIEGLGGVVGRVDRP